MAIGRSRTRSLWWRCVIRFKRPTRGRFDSKILFQRRKNRFLPATRESLGVAALGRLLNFVGFEDRGKVNGGLGWCPASSVALLHKCVEIAPTGLSHSLTWEMAPIYRVMPSSLLVAFV